MLSFAASLLNARHSLEEIALQLALHIRKSCKEKLLCKHNQFPLAVFDEASRRLKDEAHYAVTVKDP